MNKLLDEEHKLLLLTKEHIQTLHNCNIPLGKITLFDLNSRNYSSEFGYYIPNSNRSQY